MPEAQRRLAELQSRASRGRSGRGRLGPRPAGPVRGRRGRARRPTRRRASCERSCGSTYATPPSSPSLAATADAHLRLWSELLRRAPEPQVAEAAVVTAFCAWQAGHGALGVVRARPVPRRGSRASPRGLPRRVPEPGRPAHGVGGGGLRVRRRVRQRLTSAWPQSRALGRAPLRTLGCAHGRRRRSPGVLPSRPHALPREGAPLPRRVRADAHARTGSTPTTR